MTSALRQFSRWLRGKPTQSVHVPPKILPLGRGVTSLHLKHPRPDDSRHLVSQICRYGTLDSPTFRRWIAALNEDWRAHRKLWELAFICQALEERDMLRAGRRGLGFAVGAERLPALFASRGCTVLATDLSDQDDRRLPWASTGQWVGETDRLNVHGICAPHAFRERVSFQPVDMNDLPGDLAGFDFTWSTCSFEHCGSLELGLRFLERQMDCLKPGGVAVHTTEFNLTSNRDTVDRGSYVIYRLRDIEQVCAKLASAGHSVEPLDIACGEHPLDRHVDEPPYPDVPTVPGRAVKHLRLNLSGYVSTSLALIIRKRA